MKKRKMKRRPFEATRNDTESQKRIKPWHIVLLGIFLFVMGTLISMLSMETTFWKAPSLTVEEFATSTAMDSKWGFWGNMCLIISVIFAIYLKLRRRYPHTEIEQKEMK